MPSPVAPVAVKPMSASPAPAAGSAPISTTDTNTSNNTGEASQSGNFAQMLLLQLGLGDTQAAAPVANEQLLAAPLADNTKDAPENTATDPANALSALFAALGMPQPKNLPQSTTSDTTAAVGAAGGNDAASGVSLTAGPNAGVALGTANDAQAAKLAGFEETLAKAEVKLETNAKTAQEVPPAVAAMHTPPPHQPVNAEAATHVATPVRDPHWAADFSQKVVWVASQEKQSAQLTLNPPQLGPLEVTINVSKDQTTAIFSSPHSEVRQAIETAMPQLREAFAAAGIQLGQASVNSESFRQQQGNEPRPGQNRGNGGNAILASDSSSDNVIASTPIRRGLSLVDTFA